jgi:DNA-binding response OmpR family regulator
MKLLVVDDEPHVGEMMRLTLEAAGYEVDAAGSGEEALAAFGDGRQYAGVLLDQKMPGINGLETMKRMLATAPDTRVVMVTAYASIELAVDAMRLGAAHFLRKPMTPETLRGAVAAALDAAPRPAPAAPSSASPARDTPRILTLTMNGFRMDRAPRRADAAPNEHVFVVSRYPEGTAETVTVTIDPEAVARVTRLTHRQLAPAGAFWSRQAERLLAGYLWSEGRVPDGGRLTLTNLSRDDVEVAAAWTLG